VNFNGRDTKLPEKHFSATLSNFILLTVTWSSQIHRDLIFNFLLQQLFGKNATMLSYIHITDFVILAFFFQEIYLWLIIEDIQIKNYLFPRRLIKQRNFLLQRANTLHTYMYHWKKLLLS
jgi:uncharacterized membrane protein YciS (DUF1049 family)